ncbi:MAG: hypothetical protein EXS37_08560 [Opitutus sp.]|nr:hypothetical protein [Opitutus sp.]
MFASPLVRIALLGAVLPLADVHASAADAVYPGKSWAQRAPADVGLDAAKLDAFVANVGGDGCIIKDGYLVKTWGEVATHKWWASASKPVLSTLLLSAVQEGKLAGVDAPVRSAGWELSAKDAAMTFRQLANMTSGYASAELPGAAWGYNDFAIQLYARSLEKIFGQPLAEAFGSRFSALQFEDGAFFGHRNNLGVVASPRDFARLGWLWLNRGHWRDAEIVSEKLFDANIRPQVPAELPRAVTKGAKPDDYLGIGSYGGGTNQTPHGPGVYGFNFWLNEPTPGGERVWPAAPADTYQANGLWNRDTLTIFPSLRMVVAVRAAQPGKFEPSRPESTYNLNLQLVVDAARPGATTSVFPGKDWEIATPESQGVDAAKLQVAVAHLEKTIGKDGVRELVVIRHGRMIWHGDDIDKVHGVWSFTKSFTSTALGLLIDDGKCTLETKAAAVVPAMAAVFPEVTLRHFATMTSGYRAVGDEPQGTYAHGPSVTPFTPGPEPLFTPPGSHFAYWDSAMNQFAHILTRIADESLAELFQRRVAGPIGLNREKWSWGDWKKIDGFVVNGGSGNKSGALKISARDAARFGLLYLNRGRWGDRQLLSARWVDEATRVQVPAGTPHGFPSRATSGPGEYGYNWWVNGLKPDGRRKFPDAPPRTYCAAGHNNNLCFVIPEWDMVIVRLGLDGSAGDKVWNTFLAKVGEAVRP